MQDQTGEAYRNCGGKNNYRQQNIWMYEFCYKVNCRYSGDRLFDRLLFACFTYNYKEIITILNISLLF